MASSDCRRESILVEGEKPTNLYVLDRRLGDSPEVKINFNELGNFEELCLKIKNACNIKESDEHVITTTHRTPVTADNWNELEAGDTLYVLQSVGQELHAQTQERVSYLPHYDTIVKGGMYEYYASEGHNPLSYALAELIDNALAATAENVGPRNIEIRLHLEESVIYVIDNGKGMTSRQLNHWAIYRLSKFVRAENRMSQDEKDSAPAQPSVAAVAPRSLNSDISYFGVGGKQAIFFIGSSSRMITKPHGFQDVHELTVSREEFKMKEKNREAIYSGYIRNRTPGDNQHVDATDETLHKLISEEQGRDSFTAVCINDISACHIPFLKNHVKDWTRQLAHIYHYYIHGPSGNSNSKDLQSNIFKNIDITVKMYSRSQKQPLIINLRDINDDLQTQSIRSAASTFEFKATVEGTGIVEGVLHYHPFLYDQETFPADLHGPCVEGDATEEDQDYVSNTLPARGRRPIFECYWNGRLIPYTAITEFDWCAVPKKMKNIPLECYNRLSGVLWTNDKFQVSTNKLTFIDLEFRLRDKNTAYARILNKLDKKGGTPRKLQDYTHLEKRTEIGREFTTWLKQCHEQCDKQIKYSKCQGQIVRPELPRNRQSPWTVFHQLEWDSKIYSVGTLVRIQRTLPILYGCVKRVLLFGNYEGDVYGTGGELEVVQEPRSLYEDLRTVPVNKIDLAASTQQIKKYIEDEEGKLPTKLIVSWPNGAELTMGDKRLAGEAVGDMKVEIANRRGELISKLPGSQQRKLLVELCVIYHSNHGDQVLVQHICQHGKTWPYWFKKMDNLKNLGNYTLSLQCVLNETGVTKFAGKELPSVKIKFSVIEAEPEKFSVGMLEGPFRIGIPFQIPLEFQDEFGHLTKPTPNIQPVLEAEGLELTYQQAQITNKLLVLKNVVAKGAVPSHSGKNFNLFVKVAGLPEESHSLKIRMLPGQPHALNVSPAEGDAVEVENGDSVTFDVEVHDSGGNITAHPGASISVKLKGASGLPSCSADISQTGRASISCGPILVRQYTQKQQAITAQIVLEGGKGVKGISPVEREIKVLPSSRASSMSVSYRSGSTVVNLESGQDVNTTAGEHLRGIAFTIYDEAGREKEITENFASQIKVNWSPKLNVDSVLHGHMPDIKVPTYAGENKYCHISLVDGSGLSFAFTVRALAGEPDRLKCKCSGNKKVRMGDVLSADILVSILDKHGNEIKKFEKGVLKDLCISGDGLVEDNLIRALAQNQGFLIQGIKFECETLGAREVCVQWRSLQDYVRLELIAGPAAKLLITGFDMEEPVSVFSHTTLPRPLVVQLCDDAGHPCHESDIRIQLLKDNTITLNPSPSPMRTDSKGQVDFDTLTISGKPGEYSLQPKAFLGRHIIAGPKLQIHIQPDPTKVATLAVEAVSPHPEQYTAGQKLNSIQVSVMAQDDHVLESARQSCLHMKLGIASKTIDMKDLVFPADTDKNSKGIFIFSGINVPEKAGTYEIVIEYKHKTNLVLSEKTVIKVAACAPTLLVPPALTGTTTVSNTQTAASRTLFRSLVLELRDKYGNKAGLNMNAKVNVEIRQDKESTPKRGTSIELPTLVGGTGSTSVLLQNGEARIQNLMIEENSAGQDGQQYMVRCSMVGNKFSAIQPTHLPFLFYNDAKKQTEMAALSKERDSLMSTIKTYRSLFDTTQQLIYELRMSLKEAEAEENKWKEELKKLGLDTSKLGSVQAADSVIQKNERERERIVNTPRRTCALPVAPKHTEVLGKIAHLAQVSDFSIARVLSWHMSGDMDCVVTHTTKMAQSLYKDSQGKQQVLPLDSVYKKNLPDWNKPLPHCRYRSSWRPPGNPVYARNLLIFPSDENSCRIVFGMLLGDTIILDTLEDANKYRQELVKFTNCPTILTREGDRIRSNGKFGGLMNKALPLDKMRGAVFSQPLPAEYNKLCKQIDGLQQFRVALQRCEEAQEDLNQQQQTQDTEEMRAKKKEFDDTQAALTVIENKLGMVQTSGGGATAVEEQPGRRSGRSSSAAPVQAPVAKKSRLSNGTPTESPTTTSRSTSASQQNQTPNSESDSPTSTQTRSLRRAAAGSSLAWQSLRKRQRKD